MWELIWLMVIMKIPILYLCWVVYWAIKSEPRPEQPASLVAASDDPIRLHGVRGRIRAGRARTVGPLAVMRGHAGQRSEHERHALRT